MHLFHLCSSLFCWASFDLITLINAINYKNHKMISYQHSLFNIEMFCMIKTLCMLVIWVLVVSSVLSLDVVFFFMSVVFWEINLQPKSFFLLSFQTLAEQLTDKELEEGRLYPPLSNIREVSLQMAVKASFLKMTFSNFFWMFGLLINLLMLVQTLTDLA